METEVTGIRDGFAAVFQQSGMMFKNGRYTFLKKEDMLKVRTKTKARSNFGLEQKP